MPEFTDKAPLDLYLLSIMNSVLDAVAKTEAAHPGWEVGATTITIRAALKPQTSADGKQVTVWADMDVGHSEQISEIPLSIRRNPDMLKKPDA